MDEIDVFARQLAGIHELAAMDATGSPDNVRAISDEEWAIIDAAIKNIKRPDERVYLTAGVMARSMYSDDE